MRAHKKPGQPNHPVKPLLALLGTPADPAVARLQHQCRGREQAATKPAVIRADQITKLTTERQDCSLRMFPLHQLIENPAVASVCNPDHRKPFDPVDPVGNPACRGNRLAKSLRPVPGTRRSTRRRQDNGAAAFQVPQGCERSV